MKKSIELAKNTRNTKKKSIIIVITAYKDYVFDARAFNYFLKPINEEKLHRILKESLLEFEKQDKLIIAKTIS